MLDKARGYWHSAELLTAARLEEAGFIVSVPLVPVRYDLLADYEGRIVRVQVKRAKWRNQRVKPQGLGDRACWALSFTRHSSGRKHGRLSDAEFDYLAVMCNFENIYFIPAAVLTAEDGNMIRTIQIKPPGEDITRADAQVAGERWEPYRNNFSLSS
jgi:hypothetical protein